MRSLILCSMVISILVLSRKKNNLIFANPGSISLPKNNTRHSYIIMDSEKITLKDISGSIIEETYLN